ncbi:MAG: hypothetical protein FJW21_14380, partial [Acidimicrobiia bacterium]|nr:hypothetical protein [Acidimicrobiia bacterium]
MVTLTTLYGALYLAIHGPVARLAPRRIQSNADRFRTAQEALGGIKEVKVLGREAFFAGAFAKSAQEFTTVIARGQIIGSVPKYFLEAVAIGGILALLLSSLQQEGNGAEVVPLLALYAAAAYRLMPALQQIYTGVTNLKFCRDLILLLRDELANQPPQPPSPANPAERLELAHSFGLDGATFRYPRSETPVLNDVTL